MKKLVRSLSLSLVFCVTILFACAQNKYIVLEYIRLKPGITDSSSIIENIRERLKLQQQRDHSVLQSLLWQSVNPNNKDYQYVAVTAFKNFNDYLSSYKNNDSGTYYSLSKGRLDSVASAQNDSFEIVRTPIFEMIAETATPNKQPRFLLN